MSLTDARAMLEIMATCRDRVIVRTMFEKFEGLYPDHAMSVRHFWSRFFNEHWEARRNKND